MDTCRDKLPEVDDPFESKHRFDEHPIVLHVPCCNDGRNLFPLAFSVAAESDEKEHLFFLGPRACIVLVTGKRAFAPLLEREASVGHASLTGESYCRVEGSTGPQRFKRRGTRRDAMGSMVLSKRYGEGGL